MGRGEVNDWQWVSMGHTGGSRNVSHRAEGQVTVNQRTLQSDNKRVNLAWVGFHILAPRCTSKTPLQLFPPSYCLYFTLAIALQCVHLIKTLKMLLFCFLAHFVGQTHGGGWNLRQQMVECDRLGWEPTATRSGKVGGHKIDTLGEPPPMWSSDDQHLD